MRGIVFLCLLAGPISKDLTARCPPQDKPTSEARDGYHFQVTDAESDVPVPEAQVSLAYWQKKVAREVRKEIEVKTDKKGLVEFPRLEAHKLAVSVTVRGYRSYWRWIRPEGSNGLMRIRLEKWVSARK
jgi:hypothetical protein